MRQRVLRVLAWLLGSVIAAVLLLAGAIRLDQYHLRNQAERLLSDVRSLELRSSAYADARHVIDRWSDEARQPGPCRADWCDAEISLDSFAWGHSAFLAKHQTLIDLYRRIGGRPAHVSASIRVRNNIIWGKSFSETVESRCSGEPFRERFCLTLIGTIRTEAPRRPRFSHPEYEIGGPSGCEGCIAGWVKFTPYANPADVWRLSDINLSCITRWHPCETQADILPSVWKELATQKASERSGTTICSTELALALSRDSERVAAGRLQEPVRGQLGSAAKLEIDEEMKPARLSPEIHAYLNRMHEYWISAPIFAARTSGRYIAFFRTPEDWPQDCMIPVTDGNLRVVREGVAEDWSDRLDPVYLPVGGISPPHIEVRQQLSLPRLPWGL
jgi:hypothetical protein